MNELKKSNNSGVFEVGSLLKMAYLGFGALSAVPYTTSVHPGWFVSFITVQQRVRRNINCLLSILRMPF